MAAVPKARPQVKLDRALRPCQSFAVNETYDDGCLFYSHGSGATGISGAASGVRTSHHRFKPRLQQVLAFTADLESVGKAGELWRSHR